MISVFGFWNAFDYAEKIFQNLSYRECNCVIRQRQFSLRVIIEKKNTDLLVIGEVTKTSGDIP